MSVKEGQHWKKYGSGLKGYKKGYGLGLVVCVAHLSVVDGGNGDNMLN